MTTNPPLTDEQLVAKLVRECDELRAEVERLKALLKEHGIEDVQSLSRIPADH